MKSNNFLLFFLLCTGLQVTVSLQSSDAPEKSTELQVKQPIKLAIKQPDRNDLCEILTGEFVRVSDIIVLENRYWWLDNRFSKFMFRLVNQQETLFSWIDANQRAQAKLKKERDFLRKISMETAIRLGFNKENYRSLRVQISDQHAAKRYPGAR